MTVEVLQQWRDMLRGVPFVRPKTSTFSDSSSPRSRTTGTGNSASQL